MVISLNELSRIVATLPIGYYAKRRIELALEEDAETSYYVPTEDRVVISYGQVATTLDAVEDIEDENLKELIIRSNLYHEISHAILTPMKLRITDIVNIFEDERIETLLRNYYMNVDFKKCVALMNHYNGEAPKNAMEAFYYCVRFRNYKPQFVKRVDEIILNFKSLNRFTDVYCETHRHWGEPDTYSYFRAIQQLYDDIAKDFNGESATSSSEDGMFTIDINADSDAKDGQPFNIDDLTDDILGELLSQAEMSEIISDAFNKFTDTSLESALSMILENFRKKNSKGSASNGYSGIINPRHCGREDYKFFEKPLAVNGSNSFGTLHLNLFIDRSGSFCSNELVVNKLIKALSHLEMKNQNFSLDLVFCSCGEELITDKSKRFIKCGGGNYLDNEIYTIFRKLQKPNTFNYNIVLFDGDAYTDAPYSMRKSAGKTFSAFDKSNCTIISDYDNEKYIKKNVKSARVIYTSNYADELIANVQQTLAKAFR